MSWTGPDGPVEVAVDVKMQRQGRHVRQRLAGRSVSATDVAVALCWGTAIHQPGRLVLHVGRRDVMRAARAGQDIRAACGVAVVMAEPGRQLVTVMRTQDRHRLKVFGRPQSAWRPR
jgi:hypothetical protein